MGGYSGKIRIADFELSFVVVVVVVVVVVGVILPINDYNIDEDNVLIIVSNG